MSKGPEKAKRAEHTANVLALSPRFRCSLLRSRLERLVPFRDCAQSHVDVLGLLIQYLVLLHSELGIDSCTTSLSGMQTARRIWKVQKSDMIKLHFTLRGYMQCSKGVLQSL